MTGRRPLPPSATPAEASRWAWACFASGLAGFLFSFTAPIPFIPTPCFVVPLGLAAWYAGCVARRRAQSIGDGLSRRRAGWGIAFGCMGWLIYGAVLAFTLGVLGGAGWAVMAHWFGPQR